MEKVIKVTSTANAVSYIPVSAIAYVQNGVVYFKGSYNGTGKLGVQETADQMGAQMR